MLYVCKHGNDMYKYDRIKKIMANGGIFGSEHFEYICQYLNKDYFNLRRILDFGAIPNVKCLRLCIERGTPRILSLITSAYCATHNEKTGEEIDFSKLFNNSMNGTRKKFTLSEYDNLNKFYKDYYPGKHESVKTFTAVRNDIKSYTKKNNLVLAYGLCFKINDKLSEFGFEEGRLFRMYDLNMFVSHIIASSANNKDDENIIVKPKKRNIKKDEFVEFDEVEDEEYDKKNDKEIYEDEIEEDEIEEEVVEKSKYTTKCVKRKAKY